VGHFEAKLYVEGITFRTNIYGQLDVEMVTLPLKVSHAKKLCSTLYSIKIKFYF